MIPLQKSNSVKGNKEHIHVHVFVGSKPVLYSTSMDYNSHDDITNFRNNKLKILTVMKMFSFLSVKIA